MKNYDCCGWATKNNLKCTDGRTIKRDSFKHNDGKKVPLVWNHKYDEPFNVLGHAILQNREEGVYTYCTFNETDAGKEAKKLVQHGDITQFSIFANRLKHSGMDVVYGDIHEVSLVIGGANPGARIEDVLTHSALMDTADEGVIYTDIDFELYHSDSKNEPEPKKEKTEDDETIADIVGTMTEKQKTAMYALIGTALEEGENSSGDEEGDKEDMKHNIFDKHDNEMGTTLSHSDRQEIITMAKNKGVNTLQNAIEIFASNSDSLKHGVDNIESLFPDYKDVYSGAPELITADQGWIGNVMTKTHKSPITRIRTRQADIRDIPLRAKGYKKGDNKTVSGNIKLISRTTDPQTVYRKDALHRDDIIDITDFDVVEYQYGVMRLNLNEEIATAIMIGDGREDGDENKIEETHIRSIWNDDELYTIHTDVDIEAARTEIQGSNTDVSFGENYIYAEAIVTASLYARENYKGSGALTFYCTPHLLNVMLLARDMNGRRIYSSKADLAAALNVVEILTVEQFAGRTRTTTDNKTKSLLGIYVNLSDYQIGSTKGGEITRFNQFDIDFNQEKYLIETRISGALTRIKSAIVLEEDITMQG